VEKPFQPRAATGRKVLEAAIALVTLEQPKLPNAALPQVLLSPAKKHLHVVWVYVDFIRQEISVLADKASKYLTISALPRETA